MITNAMPKNDSLKNILKFCLLVIVLVLFSKLTLDAVVIAAAAIYFFQKKGGEKK